MILSHPGRQAPESKAPQGNHCSNTSTYVLEGHPQNGGPDTLGAAAEARQRRRERLELAAIAAGSCRPEQLADALLSRGVGL
jgi:hypothetical protein